MKKICINLKSNLTRKQFEEYTLRFNAFLEGPCEDVVVFPPAQAFYAGNTDFIQGAQNFYPATSGAFTGEITANQLEEFGIKTVLIGHCERRALGESEEFLARKLAFAKKQNYRIIYCIGESLDEYNAGKSLEILNAQLANLEGFSDVWLAYEPVFAIGGNRPANIPHVKSIFEHLRSKHKGILLYGGSVNPSNMSDFSGFVDGFLVGSAGLCIDGATQLVLKA